MMVLDKNTELLADEIARVTGEDKHEVIRKALEQRKATLNRTDSLDQTEKKQRWQQFLESEVWSTLPDDIKGKGTNQQEQDKILGYDS
jgi:antitoxin VapB